MTKTAREIELEKKLEIAVKALILIGGKYFYKAYSISRRKFAQESLKEIGECTYSEKA